MTGARTVLGALGAFAAAFGLGASAETPPSRGEGWIASTWGVAAYFDSDVRMDVVYTGRADEPNLALLCDDGSLRVRIGVDPGTDVPAAMREIFRARDRIVYGTLSVAGTQKAKARAIYLPTHRIVAPEGRKTAAAVFNAVAKGEAITYSFRGETVSYALPPIDDAFRSWLGECKARGAI